MNRSELKQQAKDAMKQASVNPVLMTLLYCVITFAISGISTAISMVMGRSITGEIIAYIISIVISSISAFIAVGYMAYTLRTVRAQETSVSTLFEYFNSIVKIFCISLVIVLLVILWSLLLIIPGIIAVYRYQMAFYIFLDDPSKGVMQCIAESKQMMIGHKWELFVLQISFILWFLLCCVTCGIAILWVTPYTSFTLAVYYDRLKAMQSGNAEAPTSAPVM